jgi:hypothetical protein
MHIAAYFYCASPRELKVGVFGPLCLFSTNAEPYSAWMPSCGPHFILTFPSHYRAYIPSAHMENSSDSSPKMSNSLMSGIGKYWHFMLSCQWSLLIPFSAWLTVVNQRWLGMRLDFLGVLLTLAVTLLTVGIRFTISLGQTSIVLSYILTVQQVLLSLPTIHTCSWWPINQVFRMDGSSSCWSWE